MNNSSPVRPGSLAQRLLRWVGQLLVLAALAALLFTQGRAALLFFQHAQRAINFPFTLNYGEGPLLDQTMRLLRGDVLYTPELTEPPYTITNYPPLFIIAQAPFAASSGPGFWYGRIISTAATVAAALMLSLLAHALTRDVIASAAAGLSLLAIPYIFHWSALARIDALALALSLAGLYVLAQDPGRWFNVFASILLLTAAIYTRQTYLLTAPLAAFVWLLGRRDVYRALVFAVGLASLVLAIFAISMVLTRGGFFLHLISANANGLDFSLISFYASEIGRSLPLFVMGGVISLIVGGIWKRPAWWLVAAYALGALLSALTIAKIGSDVNYLWEFSAGLCLLAGLLIAVARRLPILRAALLIALAIQILLATDLSRTKYNALLEDRLVKSEALASVVFYLETHNDPLILADELTGELVISGRQIAFQPFEFSQLSRDGVWDESPFIAALERGEYPVVMVYQPFTNPTLRFERWTQAMLRVLNDRFRPDFISGETTVYRYLGS
ncbi:MAG: hypothetical protein IPK19_09380 [Chloroflexi bacterium]|nr:hypothetical protein [Chloroflexota bacterium]